ncbi:MAG: thioredoxin family protein [Promethearchaeota archaeon]
MGNAILKYLDGIEKEEFNKIINQNKLVVVDCFAEWCGPCQSMKPIFAELAEEYVGKIKFVTIDTDNCDWINKEFDIDSIPRFLFFKDGKKIFEQRGASSKDAFDFVIRDILLGEKFDKFHEFENITETEFNKIINDNENVVVYIYKPNGDLNPMFKPIFVSNSEKYNEIYFMGLSITKNQWIQNHFGIKNEEYLRYGEKEKKVPYLLFYKNGKLLMETGVIPPDEIESIILGKLLKLIKVEEFPNGISQNDFQKILEENKYVIVDIYTTWCGPCKMMRPIFEQLSAEYEQIKFISIDLDQTPWLGSHPKYGTDAIPTFLFFKDKKLIKKNIGGMSKSKFEEIIKKEVLKD